MARMNNTPVSFWLDLRLEELMEWIQAHNQLQKKMAEEAKRNRGR